MKLDNKVTDYSGAYRKARIFVVAVCLVGMCASMFIIKSGLDRAEECRQAIYVADANNTLMLALAGDVDLNAPNEAKAALKRMHYYLFNLTPAAPYIKASLEKAEAIGDGSVRQYVEKMKEKGWYNKMIAEGISTEFLCDSISICESDNGSYAYKATLYGKTSTIYSDRIEFRSLVSECYMYDDVRTVVNPNGSYVALWKIDALDVIKVLERDRQEAPVEAPVSETAADTTETANESN